MVVPFVVLYRVGACTDILGSMGFSLSHLSSDRDRKTAKYTKPFSSSSLSSSSGVVDLGVLTWRFSLDCRRRRRPRCCSSSTTSHTTTPCHGTPFGRTTTRCGCCGRVSLCTGDTNWWYVHSFSPFERRRSVCYVPRSGIQVSPDRVKITVITHARTVIGPSNRIVCWVLNWQPSC